MGANDEGDYYTTMCSVCHVIVLYCSGHRLDKANSQIRPDRGGTRPNKNQNRFDADRASYKIAETRAMRIPMTFRRTQTVRTVVGGLHFLVEDGLVVPLICLCVPSIIARTAAVLFAKFEFPPFLLAPPR